MRLAGRPSGRAQRSSSTRRRTCRFRPISSHQGVHSDPVRLEHGDAGEAHRRGGGSVRSRRAWRRRELPKRGRGRSPRRLAVCGGPRSAWLPGRRSLRGFARIGWRPSRMDFRDSVARVRSRKPLGIPKRRRHVVRARKASRGIDLETAKDDLLQPLRIVRVGHPGGRGVAIEASPEATHGRRVAEGTPSGRKTDTTRRRARTR